jgi:Tol biopolymer transport system component/predicted Ser/Thr protein kinase
MIGRTIDRYRVVAQLGQGGMGVVYQARDTVLERLVALKVLPADKSADPARRQRFLQEAKAASALNHPGIVSVYDVLTVDGQDVIVMELVEGETLEQLLAARRLPLGRALDVAARIADAVARAHAAGIVHRDLKPSNVMVTADGVKVLDFGLAKLAPTPFADSAAPTLAEEEAALTRDHVILGTLGYMSPEQASGQPVDTRSDVFSFGVVLYEMLTGAHPFRRPTASATLSAIKDEEPVAPTRLVPGLPAEAERAVVRCLRKEPGRRWQSLSDLAALLQDLKEDTDSGRTPMPAGERAAGSGHRRPLVAGALVLAVAAGVALVLRWRAPGHESEPIELSRLTYDGGASINPAISPDGKLVAYASDREGAGQLDLWVRHVAQPGPARLTHHPANDWLPSFAPDGSRLVFRSEREGGGLYLVNVLGGDERRLVSGGTFPRFSPDGTRVLYLEARPYSPTGLVRMLLVPVDGGEPQPLAPGFGAASAPGSIGPLWSPDGTRVLFQGKPLETPGPLDWWIVPVAGGAPVSADAATGLPRADPVQFPCAWLPGDRVLFLEGTTFEGLNLHTVQLSPGGRVAGPPRTLTTGPGMSWTPSVAGDGRIALDRFSWVVRLWEVALDPRTGRALGEARRIDAGPAPKFGFALDGEGTLLAFSELSGPRERRRNELHLRNLDNGRESVPVSVPATALGLNPRVSADGKWLAWWQQAVHESATFVAPTAQPEGRELCRGCTPVAFVAASGDLLVLRGRELARIPTNGGPEAPGLDLGQEQILDADASPDGHWVALSLGKPDGRVALRIQPLAAPSGSRKATIEIGDRATWTGSPRWSADGRFLYYLSNRDDFNCVWAVPLDPATKRPSGEPFAVLHSHGSERSGEMPSRRGFSIAVSRRRLVVNAGELSGEIYVGRVEPPE